jgi:outer membrane immunogenic protein
MERRPATAIGVGLVIKRVFHSVVALGALVTPVLAADLAPLYRAPPPSPICIWCGLYVGVNAGYGWSSESASVGGSPLAVNAFLPGTSSLSVNAAISGINGNYSPNAKGIIGGGQVGYLFQLDRWVAGIETDLDSTLIKGQTDTSNVQTIAGFPGTGPNSALTVYNKVGYLGTFRGEFGYTITPTLLLYGTGGLAYGGVKSNTTINQVITGPAVGAAGGPYGSTVGISDTRVGWVAGAGLEWMFWPQLSTKIEYLHYDLGSVGYAGTLTNLTTAASGAGPAGSVFYSLGAGSSARFDGEIVRGGLNYHF